MQDLAALIPGGVVVLTLENEIVYLNPFAAQLVGYEPGALIGQRVDVLLTIASRIYYQTHLYPLITLGKVANELYLTLQNQTGSRIPVLLNASRQPDATGQPFLYICLIPVYQRRQYEQELLASKKKAEQALLRTDHLVALQAQLEHHQAELDRQVTSLQQRNDELEQFGRIITHDLQEPLRKITLFASLLDQETTTRDKRGLRGLFTASTRLRQLIHNLQLYFMPATNPADVEPVELTNLIQLLIQEYAATGVQFDLTPLPDVVGYRHELTSLFRHLLDNTVTFRQATIPPVVQISGTLVGHNSYRATPDKYHYIDYARIVISDNGIGFNNQYRDDIFRLLKKLDSRSPGIGMGLSIAKKIVERHHGLITAESTEGQGTRITLLLPIPKA